MKCPKCGNEVLSTDSHCGSCGVHLATAFQQRSATAKPKAPPSGKVCPKCGHPVKSTDITCGHCTHYLGSSPITTTAIEKQQGTQPTNVTQSNKTLEDPYYKQFRSLPISLALGTALIGFILGCVLEEGWIFLVGLVLAFFTWYDARIIIAPIITAINYLRAIERNTRKK